MILTFIDSSVLFAASYSSTGASREILRLAILDKIRLVISNHVTKEVGRNLERKAPHILREYKKFIENVPFRYIKPTKQDIENAASCVELKDAPILAAARKSHADYLVSLDRRHLVGVTKVQECAEVEILLPQDLLHILRN